MDIDFPLLETTRPAMYTFDKYVGKKPHNIWASYIEAYTKKNGIVLDMFGGSGVCATEALILGRRVITNDLNPMHDFRLETFLKKFDMFERTFCKDTKSIIDEKWLLKYIFLNI